METMKISNKKKIRNALFIFIIIIMALLIRIGYIQFIKGEELQNLAYDQQSLNRNVNPKRGTIYDATGKYELAVSSTVETITVNPMNIENSNKEKVAKTLSDIFEIDYEKVLKKIKKRSSIEIIAKKVDKEKADKLRVWMKENDLDSGINIDEDTKRYYPYRNLAAQVIGFCGGDNQGLDGVEAKFDQQLKGKVRKY